MLGTIERSAAARVYGSALFYVTVMRWMILGLALVGCQRITNAQQEQPADIDGSTVNDPDGGYVLSGNAMRRGMVQITRLEQYPSDGGVVVATVPTTDDKLWTANFSLLPAAWMAFPGGRQVAWLRATLLPTLEDGGVGAPEGINVDPPHFVACAQLRNSAWDVLGHEMFAEANLRRTEIERWCFERPEPLALIRNAQGLPAGNICRKLSIGGTNPPTPFTHRFVAPSEVSFITPAGLAASGDVKGRHHVAWLFAQTETLARTEFAITAPVGGRVVAVRKQRFSQCGCNTTATGPVAVDESYAIEVEYNCGRTFRFDHLSRLDNDHLRRAADQAWVDEFLSRGASCGGSMVSMRECSLAPGRYCETDTECSSAGAGSCALVTRPGCAQPCGEPAVLFLGMHSVEGLDPADLTVAAGATIGWDQRRNRKEQAAFTFPSNCEGTQPGMDIETEDQRADLARAGFAYGGETRNWVNPSRYESTPTGGYASMRHAICPLREYTQVDGSLSSFGAEYLDRVGLGTSMEMNDACVLIQDRGNTLAGQWWSDFSASPPQRVAFSEDGFTHQISVSYLDNTSGAVSLRLAMTSRICGGSTISQPSMVSTDVSAIDWERAVDGVIPDTTCFDSSQGGSTPSQYYVRVQRTTDPWQVQVEVGPGDCCAPPVPSRQRMMYR